jgi:regulator of sirC expression with transglutaminase-like and TPR domain
MNDPTLAALINLMDEPDETAFSLIREQIILRGSEAIPPLEKCLENSFNSIVQERIQSVIRKLNRDHRFNEFSDWLQVGSSDLLKGMVLVSKTLHPALKEEDIVITVEQLKMDVWIEMHENLTALENVKVLNHIIFDIHHFEGNRGDLTLPDNNCIHWVLENKKGSPLSLGILYMVLAQKLGLPVYGVNLPQHFILAYLAETGIDNPGKDDVLFYINPFSRGAVFKRRDIELFIGQTKIKPQESFFVPCSNPEIMRLLINDLVVAYSRKNDSSAMEDLETLLTAFE